MTIQGFLDALGHLPARTELRIGDQIEAGPYLHQSPGGIWTNRAGTQIIITANDDDLWKDETVGNDSKLPLIWKP